MNDWGYEMLHYFILLVNVKGNINQHFFCNYTSLLIAVIGWLWI